MPKKFQNKDAGKYPKQKSVFHNVRIPPHNIEMERALIGSLLIDSDGYGKVAHLIKEEEFYDKRLASIFKAVRNAYEKNIPVNVLTVSEVIRNEPDTTDVNIVDEIISLSNEVASSAHIEHYAEMVHEKYVLRRLIDTANSIIEDAYDNSESKEVLEDSLTKMFELLSSKDRGGFQDIEQVVKSIAEHIDMLSHNKSGITGVATGFPQLDRMTSGFQKGDLIIIAARPSMGKTSFALDIARFAALKNDVTVAFFSLEMAAMQIAMRLLAAEGNIDVHRLRQGRPRDQDLMNIAMVLGKLKAGKFFIDDTGSLGMPELRARARQLKQQYDIGILFIDYLQLMKPPQAQSREQEVSKISRGLKALAKELEIPVVALSQLSRAVEHRTGEKKPQLSDLRDSGSIEQDADLVMFIYREIYYKDGQEQEEVDNTAEIILRKQRNGPTGTVELVFNNRYSTFENKEPRGDELASKAPSDTDVKLSSYEQIDESDDSQDAGF